MCEFLSCVKVKKEGGSICPYYEDGDKWYFLTHDLIHNTPRGKLLQEKYGGGDDLIGHSAIREYFNLREGAGENWEQTDFSTPDNFAAVLVKAIKRGDFRGFGEPQQLLTQQARAEYQKIVQPAWAEYQKIVQPARAEYQKIVQPAEAEYQKIVQPALWDLFAITENRVEAWR